MTRRAAAVGAVLVVLYVAFAAVTTHPSGRRPLFDGFAPPTPYRWVHPPTLFESVNVKPKPAGRTIDLGSQGSSTTAVATDDGQALLSLETGAIPPRPADTKAEIRLTPFDASTLGPLPNGVRFESNAYRLTVRYLPSGTAVTTFAAPGTLAMTAAGLADSLYFAAGGRQWERLDALPFGVHAGLTADIRRAGYYVITSPGRAYKLSGGGSSPALYVAAGIGVFVIIGAVVLRRRWR